MARTRSGSGSPRAVRARSVSSVDAILAQPSATGLFSPHGPELWDRLRKLKDEVSAKKIGRSRSIPPTSRWSMAKRFKPDLVQAPASRCSTSVC